MSDFYFQNQYAMLTYKTHLNKEEFKNFITARWDKAEIHIAHETGDEQTPYEHTHCWVNFGKRVQSKNARFLDFGEIHPHIERMTTKSHRLNGLKYLSKEDPECAYLKNATNDLSLTEKIADCKTLMEALTMNVVRPGDAMGVKLLWEMTRSEIAPKTVEYSFEWQRDLRDELMGSPDYRKIIWYVDPVGNTGKTQFVKNYITEHPKEAYAFTQFGGQKDTACIVQGALASGNSLRVVLIDLPRDAETHAIYEPIEAIKNGMITSIKYQGGTVTFDNPHVVVFSNFTPNYQKLSLDRIITRKL